MVCVKCGKEIENNAVFCPYCGASVTEKAETQDISQDENVLPKEKFNPKMIGFYVLGFLLAPISWIFCLLLKKRNPQISFALGKGLRLFQWVVGVPFVILCFLGLCSQVLSFFINLLIKDNLLSIIGYFILIFLLSFGISGVLIEELPKLFNKKSLVKSKKTQKKNTGVLSLTITLFITVIIAVVGVFIYSNDPYGKNFVKYDNYGNEEYILSFSKDKDKNSKILELKYVYKGNSISVKKVRYRYNLTKRKGEDAEYFYNQVVFTLSKNILVLSAANGVDLPKGWNYNDSPAVGIYIETKIDTKK